MNYVVLIQRFLNLQTCLFVLEPDYADIKIEAGLMSQPLFLYHNYVLFLQHTRF